MFKRKSKVDYWQQFSSYQTFQTVEDLNAAVKQFIAFYDLTDAIKAVLNTIKLHAKRYFGVCWLRKEKIAQKAGVSPSTVDRAIKGLKETGFLTVIPFNHTKFGRRTHNVYILNPFQDVAEEVDSIESDDVPQEVANEVAQEVSEEPSKSCAAKDSDVSAQTHKNPHTNSNKTLKDLSIKIDGISIDETKYLKHVPNEFIELLEPFYGHSPKIIRDRWKTVCSAVKKNCVNMTYTSWESIGEAWNGTVKALKRGKIKRATDDGIGAYFYGALCDYLFNDFVRNGSVHA